MYFQKKIKNYRYIKLVCPNCDVSTSCVNFLGHAGKPIDINIDPRILLLLINDLTNKYLLLLGTNRVY